MLYSPVGVEDVVLTILDVDVRGTRNDLGNVEFSQPQKFRPRARRICTGVLSSWPHFSTGGSHSASVHPSYSNPLSLQHVWR